ncbi:MAG: TIGR02099 family protein [Lysobacter sp.]|nr:TIGR02099 family protein [Lysobacter sp.]
MPIAFRRHARTLHRAVWYALAAGLILMAMVAAVTSQLLPMAERHPDRIAAWLSERAGRPVAFDRVETEWTRRGPLLRLAGLRIGAGEAAVPIGEAEILVAQYAGLLPGRSFTELRLRGLSLTLERSTDGRWNVLGLPGQKPGGDPLKTLEGLGELQVIGGKLAILAPSMGIDVRLPEINLRMQVNGERVRVGVRGIIARGAMPMDAVLDFDRNSGNGRIYAGSRRVDLEAWSSLLRIAGVEVRGGSGRAQAWGELHAHRIASITVDTDLDDLALQAAGIEANAGKASVRFDNLTARARWRMIEGGWRFDAPTLRITTGDATQDMDGLMVAGGRRYALLADNIDAGPLLAAAALSDRLDPALRRWLSQARPSGHLQRVVVAGVQGGRMRADGALRDVAFAPVGGAPGVSGIGGTLQGDSDAFSLQLDPASAVHLDWVRAFGDGARDIAATGTIAGWRESNGWRIATESLRLDGGNYGFDLRGGLLFNGDATRPRIDLAVAVDDLPFAAAKSLWIRHAMSPALVRWLDTALVAGTVHDGRAIIAGDLDDWPFRDGDGSFSATGTIRRGNIKFRDDWPAYEISEADVAFVGNGATFDGKGAIAGVGLREVHAEVTDFSRAELKVGAQGGGDASTILALLKQSPLQKTNAATLARIDARGPTTVGLTLLQPLYRGALTPSLDGKVELLGATLVDRELKLTFDDVRGAIDFNRSGFGAEKLAVRHEQQPGRLSLRAGGYARDKRQAFEAELDAAIAADALLDRASNLDWLKPHMDGRSTWTIALAIPRAGAARGQTPSGVQLRSNLVGTALTLPAPLNKSENAALPTTVDIPLPLGSGEIRVALGTLLAVRARRGNGQTGIRAVLGESSVNEPAPVSGLIATGRAVALDAIEWISIAKGGGGQGDGPTLRRIDVTADRLLLLGGAFRNTRLQVAAANNGTAIQLQGDALAGALLVPQAEGAAIAGRLERLHWRSALPAAGSRSVRTPAGTTPVASELDPAKVPPLTIDVADLRFGTAAFGTAKLRTRPIAGGMRIEQLQLRAPKQRIDINGEWVGRGTVARTRMGVTVASDDFGALLTGFGFGGRLAGGDGTAKFDASWPGSPAAFKLERLDGSLNILAKDGRLVEIEPGAGRVLGLLSLAELPRRLTLDFRDFFNKGFAFNRIGGNIRFGNGRARSDDLLIDGPAAEIRIRGAADLRAQQFDQTIEVRPKAGNLLTAVGAIAGGPVGAAIGAAANAVLRKPLGQMAAKTYRVTGPWKDPKVEVIGRQQSTLRTRAVPSG